MSRIPTRFERNPFRRKNQSILERQQYVTFFRTFITLSIVNTQNGTSAPWLFSQTREIKRWSNMAPSNVHRRYIHGYVDRIPFALPSLSSTAQPSSLLLPPPPQQRSSHILSSSSRQPRRRWRLFVPLVCVCVRACSLKLMQYSYLIGNFPSLFLSYIFDVITSRANPKSATLQVWSSVINILRAAKSRCIICMCIWVNRIDIRKENENRIGEKLIIAHN